MTIFNFIYKLFKVLGAIVILIVFSYLITSITYYSLDREIKEEYPIHIMHNEKINCIDIYNKEYISINIEIEGEYSEEYLVAYAYSYFVSYQKEIYLYLIDENKIVCVGKNEVAKVVKTTSA